MLRCLPGLDDSDAQTIIAKRQSDNTVGGMAWLADTITPAKAAAIGGLITGRSAQYSADIVGVSGDGRAYKRVRIVLDTSKTPYTMVYRKDLTALGWPLEGDSGISAGRTGSFRGIEQCQGRRISVRQLRAKKILGVAITAESFLVAEIHCTGAGGRRELRRCAEFRYPEGTSAADLAPLGRPFAQFLRQQGFSANQVVIGLPTNWVMSRSKELTPADIAAAANILRLQAETDFSTDLKDLVYDYAGEPDRSKARSVFLMATPRARLEQIVEMARSARLNVRALTPTVASLAAVCRPMVEPEGLVAYAGPRSLELAFCGSRGLQQIRHVSLVGGGGGAGRGGESEPRPEVQELAVELRRTVASLPQNGTPASQRRVVFWDGSGLSTPAREFISTRLGMTLNIPSPTDLGMTSVAGNEEIARCIPAIALALAAASETGLPCGFYPPATGRAQEADQSASDPGGQYCRGVFIGGHRGFAL